MHPLKQGLSLMTKIIDGSFTSKEIRANERKKCRMHTNPPKWHLRVDESLLWLLQIHLTLFFFFCYPSVVDVPSSPGEKHSPSLLLWTDSLTPVQAFSFVNHLTLQRLDRQLSEVRRAGTWKGREGCLPLEQHSSSQHKRPNNCFIHSLTHSVLQPAISLHLSHCPSSLLPLIFLSVCPSIYPFTVVIFLWCQFRFSLPSELLRDNDKWYFIFHPQSFPELFIGVQEDNLRTSI